jgi:uncharacterized protein
MEAVTGKSQGARPFGLFLLGLSVVGIFALGLVITVLAGIVAILIDAALFGWRPPLELIDAIVNAIDPEQSSLWRLALALSTVFYGATIIATLLFARWRGGPAWRDLIAWHAPQVRLTDRWIWIIIVAVAVYGFGTAFFLEPTRFSVELAKDRRLATLIISFLFVAGAAPIVEELLFRGWIYTGLRHRLGMWPALLVSSAIFALAHYTGRSVIFPLVIFPVGMALGGLRERAGTIKVSIAFHMFWNFTVLAIALIA